jgi:hypothetical protein
MMIGIGAITNVVPVSDAIAAAACDSFTCASVGSIDETGNFEVLTQNQAGNAYVDVGIVPASVLQNLGITLKPSIPGCNPDGSVPSCAPAMLPSGTLGGCATSCCPVGQICKAGAQLNNAQTLAVLVAMNQSTTTGTVSSVPTIPTALLFGIAGLLALWLVLK